MSKKSKIVISLAAILIGALAGFLYYQYVGCNGTCNIWSSAWRSVLYTALLSFLFVQILLPASKNKNIN